MSDASVSFAFARADHRFRARNYVKVPAQKKKVMKCHVSRDPYLHPSFTWVNFTQFIFYGQAHIGAVTFHRSFTQDWTPCKAIIAARRMFIPICHSFSCLLQWHPYKPHRAICVFSSNSLVAINVFFFYVSVHHRSNWQFFVYTWWGNKWDEYNRGDNKRMFLNVQGERRDSLTDTTLWLIALLNSLT